jgi:polysaccharide deacetylase family protein (PEP-CTERM system associated)
MTAPTWVSCLSVDLEDWQHANYPGVSLPGADYAPSQALERQIGELLQLFADARVRATFFVLGCIADRRPGWVRRVADAGHEIASHGWNHSMATRQSREEYREDVRRTRRALQDATGAAIAGYRAPSWSITARNAWAYDVLLEEGHAYSSSVFPGGNFLYGWPGATETIHRVVRSAGGMWEFPVPVLKLGPLRIAPAGGFYLRALPLAFATRHLRRLAAEQRPGMIYVHPREIDPKAPRLELKLRDRLVHYVNLHGLRNKLRELIRLFPVAPAETILLRREAGGACAIS